MIIWGECDEESKYGVVVDRCPVCAQVAVLRVSHVYRKSHVYGIPFGAGKLVYSKVACATCKLRVSTATVSYPRYLTEAEARGLSLADLLRATNPRLAGALTNRAALEQAVRDGPADPGGPDPRVQLAFARLAEFDRAHPEVIALHQRLSRWGESDAAAREQLVGDLDAFFARAGRSGAALALLRLVAQQYPNDRSVPLTLALFFGTWISGTVALLSLIAAVWPDNEWLLVAGCLLPPAVAVLAAAFLPRLWRRNTLRRYFRNLVIPAVDRRGVDFEDILPWLRAVDLKDKEVDAR